MSAALSNHVSCMIRHIKTTSPIHIYNRTFPLFILHKHWYRIPLPGNTFCFNILEGSSVSVTIGLSGNNRCWSQVHTESSSHLSAAASVWSIVSYHIFITLRHTIGQLLIYYIKVLMVYFIARSSSVVVCLCSCMQSKNLPLAATCCRFLFKREKLISAYIEISVLLIKNFPTYVYEIVYLNVRCSLFYFILFVIRQCIIALQKKSTMFVISISLILHLL